MVLLVAAHRFTEVIVKLSAWTAVYRPDCAGGLFISRHFHVTAGRRDPGAARNMAFAILSGQREINQKTEVIGSLTI